jgi:hypothetical protein
METEPPQDLRRLVHSTANRMLEESLRNLRQHNEVRRLIARGELTDLELNAAYHDYERQAAAIYRQAVADLTVRYHASLAELGVDYSRRFYEEVLAKYSSGDGDRQNGAGPSWSFSTTVGRGDGEPSVAAPTAAPAGDGPRPKRVALELHAPLGAVASGAFSLENRRDEPADVSFVVSSWTASDGRVVDVPVVLSPPELQIAPRASADVTIAVRLLPDVFAPDQLYTTSVVVKGYDGLELLLTVWAEPVPGPEVVEVDVVEVTTVVAGAEGLVPPVLTPPRVNHAEARPAGNGSRRATAAGRSVKVAAQPRKTAPKATEPRKGAGPRQATGQRSKSGGHRRGAGS